MPELPEVETVRQILKTQVIGLSITKVEILYPKILEEISPDDFAKQLIGEKIVDIKRYGKYLIFIGEKNTIISHLRMEGKYFIKSINDQIEKHEHIIITFDDNTQLRYHDTRRFGRMTLLNTTNMIDIMNYPKLKKLGREANSDIDLNYLLDKLATKRLPIKSVLLDQEIISGIGNIYADEICFKCHLHPAKPANTITRSEASSIIRASKETLEQAILSGGTTIRSYTSSLGVTGRFQLNLNVHMQENKPCHKCQTIIKKMVVKGRGTYLCPTCQAENINIKIIGLTGIIGSGKSTIADYIAKLGYKVIDADIISRNLVNDIDNNPEIKSFIQENFPECLLNNHVDRNLLGKIIFHDQERRQILNNFLHPIIKKEMIIQMDKFKDELIINKKTDTIILLVVPLLFEAHYEDLCDEVIISDCDSAKIIERLSSRDHLDVKDIEERLNSQFSLTKKIEHAASVNIPYYVIINNSDIVTLYETVKSIINHI